MTRIYLDYAAATPVSEAVARVVSEVQNKCWQNPSAFYASAREAADEFRAAQKSIAGVLGVKPDEIVLTSGSTEANNMAVFGVVQQFPKSRIAIGAMEHESVRQAALAAAPSRVDVVKTSQGGRIRPQDLKNTITDETVLVSIALADSEIGVIQPLAKLAQELVRIRKQRRSRGSDLPLYFHTDASAAANYLRLNMARLGVDMMSLGGAKVYGPPGSGLLVSQVKIKPIFHGGAQQRGLRAGTEDVAAAAGLAEALRIAQSEYKKSAKTAKELREYMWKELINFGVNVTLNESGKFNLPNILNITSKKDDGETLVMALDFAGLEVGTGAACSARSGQPSPVLLGFGLTKSQANRSLRISLGRPTTKAELRKAAGILARHL